MSNSSLRRVTTGALPVVALLALLLVSLHLMSSAVQNTEELSRIFIPLLLFTLFGLLVLVVLVLVNVVQLVKRYRSQAAGSRLTLRMVVIFVALALVPVTVVYFYSQQFLMHGIENWFDVKIDRAMEDALDLSKASLDLHRRERLRTTNRMLSDLDELSVAGLNIGLEEMRDRYGATELTLMNRSGVVITSSNADPSILVPDTPDMSILQQVLDGSGYIGLAPLGELSELHIRVVVSDVVRPMILQAMYPTSDSISELSEKVQQSYNHYKELAYLRESLKSTFTLALALVLLFSLFSAIWAAFFTARRLVAPVADIAEGTKAVADGDYGGQLPVPKHRDEISTLVTSFNSMTQRIAQARDLAESSQRQAEAQRAYLETVLGNLSSGVMTFDPDGNLRTSNRAASEILQVDVGSMLGEQLQALSGLSQKMQQFVDLLQEPLSEKGQDWHSEITLYGSEGRQVLLCHSTPLAGLGDEGKSGHVLVFDDITTLIRAQRDSAWGEVARRLAHEIKNPLTPIQLAAERLRHKYLRKMHPDDSAVLDRSTHTIVQQVEAMKEMVNAFSDYARPPKMNPQPLILDQLVSEVLDLYRHSVPEIEMGSELASEQAQIEADPVRMRQVVHNLVKNAQEAVLESGGGVVEVSTCQRYAADCQFVEFQVSDNGPGFNDQNLTNLFEPYVTTKAKGTGLGLAIVKKIIEEHGGMIWAENRDEGGGRVVFRLPTMAPDQGVQGGCSGISSNNNLAAQPGSKIEEQ
jgi:nitrogen fixation/metabolism regulation signal transduction histidine kinase